MPSASILRCLAESNMTWIRSSSCHPALGEVGLDHHLLRSLTPATTGIGSPMTKLAHVRLAHHSCTSKLLSLAQQLWNLVQHRLCQLNTGGRSSIGYSVSIEDQAENCRGCQRYIKLTSYGHTQKEDVCLAIRQRGELLSSQRSRRRGSARTSSTSL